MALPLFCYGTLAFPAVMRVVAGQLPEAEPACLPGYRCALLAGRPYPGIAPATDSVRGLLYRNPGQLAMARLDRFEGREYQRRVLTVEQDGRQRRAWVYVPDPRCAHLGVRPWDAAAFARQHLQAYLRELT